MKKKSTKPQKVKPSPPTPKPQRKKLEQQDLDVFLRQERLVADYVHLARMVQAAHVLLKQQIKTKYGLSDSYEIVHATGEIIDHASPPQSSLLT